MTRILFLTNRNIVTTCGELRLIKNRAETLFDEYCIATDFLAICKNERLKKGAREHIYAGGETKLIPVSGFNPVELFEARKKLFKEACQRLEEGQYDTLLISGVGLEGLARDFRRRYENLRIILDIHGALEDSLEIARSSSDVIKKMRSYALYALSLHTLAAGLRFADGCIVVTDALVRYLKAKFAIAEGLEWFIVPCAIRELPPPDAYAAQRRVNRKKYGLGESTFAYVYSGGSSSWQCVSETVQLYRKLKQLHEANGEDCRLLIFSHEIEDLEHQFGGDGSIIFDSHNPQSLFGALCAADIAFLLRRNSPTNRVAFPNKFLEYAAARLAIVSTPYVEEIAQQIKEHGIGVLYTPDCDIALLREEVLSLNRLRTDPDVIKSYAEVVERSCFRKTLERFANACDA